MKIVCDVDVKSVMSSKLFACSTRKRSIVSKMSRVCGCTVLHIQSPSQVSSVPFSNGNEDAEDSSESFEDESIVRDSVPNQKESRSNDGKINDKGDDGTHDGDQGLEAEDSTYEDEDTREDAPDSELNSASDSVESCNTVKGERVTNSADVCEEKVVASSFADRTSEPVDRMNLEVKSIKAFLNLSEDTEGVQRVRQIGNEVWVHYQDSVNLNDVLVPVMESLSSSSYSYLEFNRLARSDNAVVFVIIDVDTNADRV